MVAISTHTLHASSFSFILRFKKNVFLMPETIKKNSQKLKKLYLQLQQDEIHFSTKSPFIFIHFR